MRTLIVKESQANKRVGRVIRDAFPGMPASAMYKAFRKRDIKVNGVRVKEDYLVSPGDRLEIFITDEILDGLPQKNGAQPGRGFSVVYEDANILIVNKEQGIPVHPDREQSTGTLIDRVKDYLGEKGEYDPRDPSCFPPSLCHRIDRNTGGLVILAKNAESLKILLDKIKSREIKKYYQCLVKGKMEKEHAELKAYLCKDENKSRAFIYDYPGKGSIPIITRYRLLAYKNGISRLEVELVTGRTHQIRAHLAHIGHPIVGDGKYGSNAYNRSLGAKYQALWAYKLVFGFKNAGRLDYLRGKKFEVTPEFKVWLNKREE
ncbi:MAG: RluA family pseudouridine synthase [Clostridiales bacterium]|nr:RluA family pseudouridine synthase [Eubacteriales bacterium]MDH7567590.1 RluA family pseudouridine synthase [Clostridiales bacterium]